MDKLSEAREVISQVDKEIALLFEKRMKAVDFLRGNPIPDGYSLLKDC